MTGLVLAGIFFFWPGSKSQAVVSPVQAGEENVHAVLRVVEKGAFILIEDAGLRFAIGDMVPLFQKSGNYYITLHEPTYGPRVLGAFPRLIFPNEPTAWVANNQLVVFGQHVESIRGKFFFYLGEELEILEETALGYQVELHREGFTMPMTIPRDTRGLLREERVVVHGKKLPVEPIEVVMQAPVPLRVIPRPKPVAPVVSGPKVGRRVEIQPLVDLAIVEQPPERLPEPSVDPLPETVLPMVDLSAENPTLNGLPDNTAAPVEPAEDVSEDTVVAAVVAPPAPQLAGTDTLGEPALRPPAEFAALSDPGPETAEAGSAPPPVLDGRIVIGEEITPDAKQAWLGIVAFLDRHILTSQLLLLLLILEAAFYVRLKKRQQVKASASEEMPPPIHHPEETVEPAPPREPAARPESDLSGSLEGFNIGQVVQFFHTSAETGALIIRGPNGHQPDKLVFRKGRIVDARSEGLAGEPAARLILRRKLGQFSFKREEVVEALDTVKHDTMHLLLECHRLIDEEGYVDDFKRMKGLVDFVAALDAVSEDSQVVSR